MRTATIQGYYGGSKHLCTIFTYGQWYVIEGSKNVNCAPMGTDLEDGVWVEEISDVDSFLWDEIHSEEELEEAVEN